MLRLATAQHAIAAVVADLECPVDHGSAREDMFRPWHHQGRKHAGRYTPRTAAALSSRSIHSQAVRTESNRRSCRTATRPDSPATRTQSTTRRGAHARKVRSMAAAGDQDLQVVAHGRRRRRNLAPTHRGLLATWNRSSAAAPRPHRSRCHRAATQIRLYAARACASVGRSEISSPARRKQSTATSRPRSGCWRAIVDVRLQADDRRSLDHDLARRDESVFRRSSADATSPVRNSHSAR